MNQENTQILKDMSYLVQWAPSLLLKKNYNRLFKENAVFIEYYLQDIAKVRKYNNKKDHNDYLRIEWLKKGRHSNVKLSYIKAMNTEETIQWFKSQTLKFSNFTEQDFESVIPLGEE